MNSPRLVLVTGSRTWTDRARVADELAAYPPSAWHLMHGAVALAHDVALSMGYRVDVGLHRRPADSAMIKEVAGGIIVRDWSAVHGLAFGSLVRAERAPRAGDRRASATGHMVALMRELGWPVRWVPTPEAEAQTLALHVYTACLRRADVWDEADLLDVTRGTGGPRGESFAPSWGLLRPALAKIRQGGAVAEDGWAWYVPRYIDEMRASYRANPEAWAALLARDRIVLGCYCRDRDRCHRGLLARILIKLGAVDCGELLAVGDLAWGAAYHAPGETQRPYKPSP